MGPAGECVAAVGPGSLQESRSPRVHGFDDSEAVVWAV